MADDINIWDDEININWISSNNDSEKQKKIQRDLILFKKFMKMNYYRLKNINELIKLPKKNEQIRLITQQSFNAFAILLWILEKDKFNEIYLTTFSIDEKTTKAIIELVKSTPNIKYTLVITSLLKYDRKSRQQSLINLAENNSNFTFIETFNHTKIIMAKSKTNNFIIEGSGNLSANARIEQYLFENSEETYNFHKSWIDNISNFAEKKDTVIYKAT